MLGICHNFRYHCPMISDTLLVKKVLNTIHRYNMFREQDRVLAAVSGGPDSVAMLHILYRLAPSLGIKIFVAHVDHLLRREESAQDAAFAGNMAVELGLEFYLAEVDVKAHAARSKKSIQEAAREVRYGALVNIGKKLRIARIATAHTADDQAETVLMNLLRGTGPEGMGGIPPVREGLFVRPLIEAQRSMIEVFLQKNNIPCRRDSSNTRRKYLRNRIRLDLLPALRREYNPALALNLSQSSDIFREESAFMEKVVDNIWPGLVSKKEAGAIHMDLDNFQARETAIQRRIIRRAYETLKGSRKGLTHSQIRSVLTDLLSGKREKTFSLPGDIQIRRSGKTLSMGKFSARDIPEIRLKVPGVGIAGSFRIHTHLRKTAPKLPSRDNWQVYFDWHGLTPPLIVRSRQPGDTMVPMGMKGHKKIQDILVDAKIPRHQRQSVPILCDGEGILWVGGIRRCARATVRPQTKSILTVEISTCAKVL